MAMRCGLVHRRGSRYKAQGLYWGLLLGLSGLLRETASAADCNGRSFERVSVGSPNGQADGASLIPFLSADGCVVGFKSDANNLVSNDSNQHTDVFVRDRRTDATTRISVNENGVEANDGNFPPALSGDGSLVAFGSFADNLVFGDSNGHADMFVANRATAGIDRVDVGVAGTQANDGVPDLPPGISQDGRFVAFTSSASNLVPFPQDLNEAPDVFVFDRQTQTTELISRDLIHGTAPGGSVENGASAPALSGDPDARYVVFLSRSKQLVLSDTNELQDVFVWDRQLRVMERVSVANDGRQGNGTSQPSGYPPTVTDDGRYVAFASDATNLVPGDDNGVTDVFIRDRVAGTTVRVEAPSGCTTGGAAGLSPSGASDAPSFSADGRFLVFKSLAANFVSNDTNNHADIFVLDRSSGLIARVLGTGDVEPNGDSNFPHISADGQWIAFQSDATNLVPDDSNGTTDIFVAANPFVTGNPIPGVTPLPPCTATPTATPTSCAAGGCPAGQSCVEDLCVTPTPTPTPTSCVPNGCPPGLVCAMDRCVTPTPTATPTSCVSGGCPEGLVCAMDRCVTPTPEPCTLTSDCPPPEVCIAGMCKPPGSCDSDDDCAPGGVCDIPNMRCVTRTPTASPTPTGTGKGGGGGGGGGCSCRVDPRAPANDETAAALALPAILLLLRRRALAGRR